MNLSQPLGARFREYLGAGFSASLSPTISPRLLYSLISLVPEVEYHFTVR